MRWHSQRIAIGMRFGPCSEQWTRTVSDIEGIVNMEEGQAANACVDSGALSEHELGTALVNGDYTVFDPHTVKMMIR